MKILTALRETITDAPGNIAGAVGATVVGLADVYVAGPAAAMNESLPASILAACVIIGGHCAVDAAVDIEYQYQRQQ